MEIMMIMMIMMMKPHLRVDGIQVLQRVGRTHNVPKLPVDLPLHAGDVEEHVHPAGELSLKYFVLLCFHLAR